MLRTRRICGASKSWRVAHESWTAGSGIDNSRPPLVTNLRLKPQRSATDLQALVASVLRSLVSHEPDVIQIISKGEWISLHGPKKEISPPRVRPRPSAASRAPAAPRIRPRPWEMCLFQSIFTRFRDLRHAASGRQRSPVGGRRRSEQCENEAHLLREAVVGPIIIAGITCRQASASVLQAAKALIDSRRTILPSPRNDVCLQTKQKRNWLRRGDRESARRTAWIPEFRTTILLAYTSSLCNVRPIVVQTELHGV